MDSIFLSLVFRNPDGSLTGYSWFLAVVALYMISSGIWCLMSPASYVRFMTRTRWVTPPSGPFWSRDELAGLGARVWCTRHRGSRWLHDVGTVLRRGWASVLSRLDPGRRPVFKSGWALLFGVEPVAMHSNRTGLRRVPCISLRCTNWVAGPLGRVTNNDCPLVAPLTRWSGS
jgi:hypothetical protein